MSVSGEIRVMTGGIFGVVVPETESTTRGQQAPETPPLGHSSCSHKSDLGTLLVVVSPILKGDKFESEAESIRRIYQAAGPDCEIMLRKSPGEVRDRINSDFPSKISIVHFIGHGDLQLRPTGPCPGQAGDENCIAFADSSTSSGYSDYSVEDFVQKVFVKKERPLALVFLNGCETVSIGLRIHEEENANNVVYWDTRCLSRRAQRFAEFFYSQLVNPRDGKIRSWSFERRCHAAFHHARTAMGQEHNMEKNPDALGYGRKDPGPRAE